MCLEGLPEAESEATDVALELLVLDVHQEHVAVEVGFLVEALGAPGCRAGEGLFPSVGLLVQFQVVLSGEAHPTQLRDL